MKENAPSLEACFHGGAFFDAIGVEFDRLQRSTEVINADVLDAWFPPSPRVINQLQEFLPWIARTSPPTNSEGLVAAISRFRNVPAESVLPGAGSSSLIFLALREWLNPSSRVLLLDPTYGEYEHVCKKVIGCRVESFPLDPGQEFQVDLEKLATQVSRGTTWLCWSIPTTPQAGTSPAGKWSSFSRRLHLLPDSG